MGMDCPPLKFLSSKIGDGLSVPKNRDTKVAGTQSHRDALSMGRNATQFRTLKDTIQMVVEVRPGGTRIGLN
jgi:membrane carboxypeptidase/penicillin-binding protein